MDLDLGQILSDGVKFKEFLKSLTLFPKKKALLLTNRENFIINKEKREQKRMRKEKNWVRYLIHVEKNGSDKMSGGNQIGSDTFDNGSDII